MFPVGLVTRLGVSSPIIRNGHINGYYDGSINNRKFAVDMAGFAFSVPHLLTCPDAMMPFSAGREETKFLEKLKISNADIEPLASNCTQVRYLIRVHTLISEAFSRLIFNIYNLIYIL